MKQFKCYREIGFNRRLATEVADALEEAADCMRFLNALRPHILKVTDRSYFAGLPAALDQTLNPKP